MNQDSDPTPQIEFSKEGCVPVQEGQTILQAAISAGIPIFHVCGGHAKCSTCRVLVVEGKEHLSTPTKREERLNRKMHFPANVRLACQTMVNGNPVTVRRIIQDEHDIGLYIGDTHGTSPQQMGEEKDLVLFFLDIRDFTQFVESHLPFDIIHIIRKLFNLFQTIIHSNGGKIVETTGDGLYAVFGCENGIEESANRATQAGLSILHDLENLNESYFRSFFGRAVEVGIGIHAGTIISGTINIENNEHMVVMGLPVNIASRLQNATKELDNSLVVSEEIHERIIDSSKAHHKTKIRVRGVSEELTVFLLGKPFRK